jgi:hypothetical protein
MLLAVLAVLAAAPVTLETGVLTPPLVGPPGEAALRYATSRAAELGLDARSTLVVGRELSTRFGGTVHLHQHVGGLELDGARVIVTFDTAQRVVRASSTLAPLGALRLEPRLTHAEALRRATLEVDGAWLQADGTPYGGATRRAFRVGDEVHVGYLVYVPTPRVSENWHVVVDAVTGAVLSVRDRAMSSNEAKVYASSPGSAGVGVTPTVDVTLPYLSGPGFLRGEYLRALNCCPTEGCSPTAGPKRATGQLQTFQGPVSFDVAICDQLPRASNDPAVNPNGTFVYAPIDGPNTRPPSITTPADYDEFAEVHAYHHVTKAYDKVRALSTNPAASGSGFSPFRWRSTGPNEDLPAVWVNVADADFGSARPNAQGVYVSDTLSRTDNAMYLARENMEYLLLPPQVLASDALIMYQGEAADFAYDGPVLWHEFGHGVVHSTSDFQPGVVFDMRSANDESAALNEAVADLIAVFTGKDPVVGAYVGPRTDPGRPAIRIAENQHRCPEVLWGQQHQDSQHFTGAVWEARQHFLGGDDGDTYAAAVYAALVSFPPDVSFESAANIIMSSVAQAFPQKADARATLERIFFERGVIGCSKILDLTGRLDELRPYFGIPGTMSAEVVEGSAVPGPIQFKIRAPRGIRSVSIDGLMQSFGGSTASRLQLLANVNQPVTFTKLGTSLQNDAPVKIEPTVSQNQLSGTLAVEVPCGGELYLALANVSRRDRVVYELGFSFIEADACPEPVVDAGVSEPDPINVVRVQETLGPPPEGCGCGAASPGLLLAGVALLLRRRARR